MGEGKDKENMRKNWNLWEPRETHKDTVILVQISLPAALVLWAICRRGQSPWPHIIAWTRPKTWRTCRKKYSETQSRGSPAAVSSQWGEPAGQWQHTQASVVPRALLQLSERHNCSLASPCQSCTSYSVANPDSVSDGITIKYYDLNYTLLHNICASFALNL